MKSPLRYPGGKTRACKILDEIITEHDFNVNSVVSPFFGGGSFEFHLCKKYGSKLIVNDKFKPLYSFWTCVKTKNGELCTLLRKYIGRVDKEVFLNMRKTIMEDTDILTQACKYFIINRCSFSGATLSGGFSLESSKKRFTESSINRVSQLKLDDMSISNSDFTEFIEMHSDEGFIFLDPPYYLGTNSKLYGSNGDMHENFDHTKLYDIIKTKKNWIMTYNNCDFIRDLYKEFKIVEVSWSYGMNKTKESSEIVIIG
jgi:DNA adenine methylase